MKPDRSWIGVLVVVGLMAAGLAVWLLSRPKPEPPSSLPQPEVVWSPSPPSGELEDSPWVKTLRESEYQIAVANNARDFTDPRLAAVVTPDVLNSWARLAQNGTEDPRGLPVMPGMTVTIVERVTEADDGKSAIIQVCEVGWEQVYGQPVPTDPTNEPGRPDMKRVGSEIVLYPDGQRRVTGTHPGVGENAAKCDGSKASFGRFDPAPTPQPPNTYTKADVKIPEYDRGWSKLPPYSNSTK